MKIQKVREKAKALGLETSGMNQVDLIHNIQLKEGNTPCFQTGLYACDQFECSWRSDCFPERAPEKGKAGERESYLRKVKAELEKFTVKIDGLKDRAKKMVGKTKAEALEEIKRLEKKSEEEIKQKMHKLAEAGEDAWQTARKEIDSSWKELKEASKKALSRQRSMKK
jgi:hypothetical protein